MEYYIGQILNEKELIEFANYCAVNHPMMATKTLGNKQYEIIEIQEYVPTKEEQEQARANAYASEIDPLHARKARKTILGEWTEEDETEYVAKVKELSAEIAERYPYPVEPKEE